MDIELNFIPLDLEETEETEGFDIGSTPATNTGNTTTTTENPTSVNSNFTPSGGGTIVKGFLKTQNFNAGTSGWSIDADGSVEFNDGNFRGDITGASGTFSGAVAASQLDIGGDDATSFHVDSGGGIWSGASIANKATAPFSVTNAGLLTSTSGVIGGWTIASTQLSSGNVILKSTDEQILIGSASAPLTGIGIFLGKDGSDYEFRAGDPDNAYFHWDGSGLDVNGAKIVGIALGTEPAIQGWSHTMVFSSSDADTVAWTSGTIYFTDGTTFSIDAGNTGNMTAENYIYFDKATSTTVLQKSTTKSNSVGIGKILISVAKNSTNEATFVSFGAQELNILGTSIATNSITANEIAANTITANELSVSQLSAIAADLGTITAGNMTINSSGYIKGGQSGYNSGTGFFLGYSSGAYKFSLGNPSGDYITWDGSSLNLNTPVNVDFAFTAGEALTAGNQVGLYGEITAATQTNVDVNQATWVWEAQPATNYDNSEFTLFVEDPLNEERRSYFSWNNLSAISVPDGATLLSVEVKVEGYMEVSAAAVDFYALNAGFDETTVTWNDKPAHDSGKKVGEMTVLEEGYQGTWTAIDTDGNTTYYDKIRNYGTVCIRPSTTGVCQMSDDDGHDTANKPRISVRITYKIRDGRIYKVNATTAEYANSYMGVAQSTVAEDAAVKVRVEGKDTNQSGLTLYASPLYLSDTDGAVSETPGTKTKIVGRALAAATDMQIKYDLEIVS
jgi:hypothetical protein